MIVIKRHAIGLIYALRARFVAMVTLFVFFAVLGLLVDAVVVRFSPADNYIKYTEFSVSDAVEGDDVIYKVCRNHADNYTYTGQMTVYIIDNRNDEGLPRKVMAKPIIGSIRTQCEYKTLLNSEYYHKPGQYQLAFCITVQVWFMPKTVCDTSNVYTVTPRPITKIETPDTGVL